MKFKKLLDHDRVVVQGSTAYAGYNAPWTRRGMNPNEVLMEMNNE